jgi:HD superfamily phosphohydrolase
LSQDRVFRDPVHGLIEFKAEDRELASVLGTRAFQRLRRIKQMGFAWLVYPGAEHSRFGHALGAYHLASRLSLQLDLDEQVGRHVKLAALLHDIGHGPFSHAWEQLFGGGDHERWGCRIVGEDPELSAVLAAIDPSAGAALEQFWTKTYRPAFARKLVSSQLDVDRLDYLLRDGHYSGAGYATFDLDWILHALRIESIHDGPDPTDLVVDYRRGMHAVEQYLFARSYMYAQVYYHKTVRAAEWMFIKLLERFAELARSGDEPAHLEVAARAARGERLAVDDYLWLDDITVSSAIDRWAGRGPSGVGPADDPVIRDLAQRLVSRRLFKTIDLGDDPALRDRIEPRARAIARDHFGAAANYYVQLDDARQIGYMAGNEEELHVVGHPHKGSISLGALLNELPLGRPISTVRLVCAPELVEALTPICAAELDAADH